MIVHSSAEAWGRIELGWLERAAGIGGGKVSPLLPRAPALEEFYKFLAAAIPGISHETSRYAAGSGVHVGAGIHESFGPLHLVG